VAGTGLCDNVRVFDGFPELEKLDEACTSDGHGLVTGPKFGCVHFAGKPEDGFFVPGDYVWVDHQGKITGAADPPST